MKTYMMVNIDRCWGCKSCVTACKREHGYPPDAPEAIDVARVEQTDAQGGVQCDFLPLMCMHCEEPACVQACPVHALVREEDGRVRLDRTLCVGCGKCERACGYGAVALERTAGKRPKALKCDLCVERRGRGLPPACVQHCMGRAFTLADEEEMRRQIAGCYHWSVGQVVYLSQKLRDLGKALE